MRIVVIHNLPYGGGHRRLSNQLAGLGGEQIEVCLSTAQPISSQVVTVPVSRRAASLPRSLRVPFRYVDIATLVGAWRRAARVVEELEPDVVFANPCRFLQGPLALRWLSGAPSLYFCDEPRRVDTEPEAAAQRNRMTRPIYWPAYRLERALDRSAVRGATRLLANSRYSAGAIRRAYGVQCGFIPLGVAAPFQAEPRERPIRHMLSVGSLTRNKGHDLVIRAAAATHRRWPVVIVTQRHDAPEEQRLHAIARDARVQLDLRVGVSDELLRSAYEEAVATLYLARQEPLGLVSLEAQSCGCPVIVAAEGGLPETIAEGTSGWSVPRQPEAAARLVDALEDTAIRAQVGRAAREWSHQFTWARSSDALMTELRAVADPRGEQI